MADSAFDQLGKFKLNRLRNPKLRLANRQAIAEKCHNAYLGDYKIICTILGRFNLFIDSRDRTIGMHLLMKGFWEIYVTECIARHVKQGMTVIDLGASYGYYSALMAGLIGNQGGRVYSIEANPMVYDMLSESMKINAFGHKVITENVAVTNATKPGSMPFNFRQESPMNGHLEVCGNLAKNEQTIEVKTNSLDNLIPPGTQVDFIKVDIEGAEHMFWQGSKRIRQENPNLKILLEFNASRYPDQADLFVQAIIDAGFAIKLTTKSASEDRYLSKQELLRFDTSSDLMLLLEKLS